MQSIAKKKIIVLEDEPAIAETLVMALVRDNFQVKVFNTAGSFKSSVRAESPDLFILDLGLPDENGIDVCRFIRQHYNKVPVIILTARSDETDKIIGLESGADDYVTKPFSPRELVARVRAHLRRSADMTEQITELRVGDLTLEKSRKEICYKGQKLSFSATEYRLLEVLMMRPGKVFSRDEIMSRAWSDPDMSMERTVDAHIKSIRAQLTKSGAGDELIVTHRGFGYSLKEPE